MDGENNHQEPDSWHATRDVPPHSLLKIPWTVTWYRPPSPVSDDQSEGQGEPTWISNTKLRLFSSADTLMCPDSLCCPQLKVWIIKPWRTLFQMTGQHDRFLLDLPCIACAWRIKLQRFANSSSFSFAAMTSTPTKEPLGGKRAYFRL